MTLALKLEAWSSRCGGKIRRSPRGAAEAGHLECAGSPRRRRPTPTIFPDALVWERDRHPARRSPQNGGEVEQAPRPQ
jgi:hypothetical protein